MARGDHRKRRQGQAEMQRAQAETEQTQREAAERTRASSQGRMNNGHDADSGGRTWSSLIYGSNDKGQDVTLSLGRSGTPPEGEYLIADGHKSRDEFYGEDDQGQKGHDHGGGRGGYKDRGQYSG